MRFHLAPRSLVQLSTAILLTLPSAAALPPHGQVAYQELFGRDTCAGQLCGWDNQLCCPNGGCYTDTNKQAQCSGGGGIVAATATTGYWKTFTTTITSSGPYTVTSVYSSYITPAAALTATATATATQCQYALYEVPCGSVCCGSSEYCFNWSAGVCSPAANGDSSGYISSYYSTMYSTDSAGVPVRPTASILIITTETASPTASQTASSTAVPTEPFQTPIAPVGGNITVTSQEANAGSSSSLSSGAIAGIVIGVLLGLFLLGLLCFYCCIKGILDGVLALFGMGGRRRERKEVDIYERHSHHHSGSGGGGGGGGGRTWYGAARPARFEERDRPKKKEGRNLLGIGLGLAALWAILGLKRRQERRREEEKSEYSWTEYSTEDPGTSESKSSCTDFRRARRVRD